MTTCCHLAFLTLCRQGEDIRLGRAARRRVLQEQFSLTALEADGQCPLHVWWEFTNDVLVVAEAGQVPAVGELGQLTTNGAGQGLELRRGHVDASEALQAEGVPARQQLWGLEDVIVCAETHSALCVLHIIFRGLHLPPVTLSFFPVPSPGLLTPAPLPPLSLVPVPVSPPASIHPLRVGTPRSPHFYRPPFLPLVLLAVTFFLVEFGFDIGGLSGSMVLALAHFRPVIAHVGGMMLEGEYRLESGSQCSNWICGKLNFG